MYILDTTKLVIRGVPYEPPEIPTTGGTARLLEAVPRPTTPTRYVAPIADIDIRPKSARSTMTRGMEKPSIDSSVDSIIGRVRRGVTDGVPIVMPPYTKELSETLSNRFGFMRAEPSKSVEPVRTPERTILSTLADTKVMPSRAVGFKGRMDARMERLLDGRERVKKAIEETERELTAKGVRRIYEPKSQGDVKGRSEEAHTKHKIGISRPVDAKLVDAAEAVSKKPLPSEGSVYYGEEAKQQVTFPLIRISLWSRVKASLFGKPDFAAGALKDPAITEKMHQDLKVGTYLFTFNIPTGFALGTIGSTKVVPFKAEGKQMSIDKLLLDEDAKTLTAQITVHENIIPLLVVGAAALAAGGWAIGKVDDTIQSVDMVVKDSWILGVAAVLALGAYWYFVKRKG